MMDAKAANKVMSLLHNFDSVKNFAIGRVCAFFLDDLFNYAGGMSNIKYIHYMTVSLAVITVTSSYLIYIGMSMVL